MVKLVLSVLDTLQDLVKPKIVDHWLISDQMLLMQQLGVVDAPAEQPAGH